MHKSESIFLSFHPSKEGFKAGHGEARLGLAGVSIPLRKVSRLGDIAQVVLAEFAFPSL